MLGDGLGERRVGAAVGPAGAERQVDAQAQLAALGLRVVHVVEHLGREEGKVLEALGRIVEHLGYSKASSAPWMPSAFICCSSRRISGLTTAGPNHHQRTMGRASLAD
jgi:hypothetical protein